MQIYVKTQLKFKYFLEIYEREMVSCESKWQYISPPVYQFLDTTALIVKAYTENNWISIDATTCGLLKSWKATNKTFQDIF